MAAAMWSASLRVMMVTETFGTPESYGKAGAVDRPFPLRVNEADRTGRYQGCVVAGAAPPPLSGTSCTVSKSTTDWL
jgi:hypothetical protein